MVCPTDSQFHRFSTYANRALEFNGAATALALRRTSQRNVAESIRVFEFLERVLGFDGAKWLRDDDFVTERLIGCEQESTFEAWETDAA